LLGILPGFSMFFVAVDTVNLSSLIPIDRLNEEESGYEYFIGKNQSAVVRWVLIDDSDETDSKRAKLRENQSSAMHKSHFLAYVDNVADNSGSKNRLSSENSCLRSSNPANGRDIHTEHHR